MKKMAVTIMLLTACFMILEAGAASLSREVYLDKCRGAWAGQMIGVCYGFPYEFKSNGRMVEGALDPWKPDRIAGAIGQDDCYVEMTFLKAIEDHGLNITWEEAGKAFAETEYPLWHANYYGRENVRRGVMPPMSGYPRFNHHADDIDFQIEADLFGILCPGLPGESNRLCDIFGHIMNYGDGVYGGMFVAGMYAAAYFEDRDVEKVLKAGLACIPADSQYAACIRDVILWHDEYPENWQNTWNRVEKKWQDDIDCMPGNPFNIDAKLNGAYIAIGMLYGNGDITKTLDISTRCGQDADCNPSNAAGVLCCMKGFSRLDAAWTSGIAAIEDKPFLHTPYSFRSLIDACAGITEAIVLRAGGRIDGDTWEIPAQQPAPPITFEQWADQKALLAIPVHDWEIAEWDPRWRIVQCGPDMNPGIRETCFDRENVLVIHPVSENSPAIIEGLIPRPEGAKRLVLEVTSDPRGDYSLIVHINGKPVLAQPVKSAGTWERITAPLPGDSGKPLNIRIENHATGWAWEGMYLHKVTLE